MRRERSRQPFYFGCFMIWFMKQKKIFLILRLSCSSIHKVLMIVIIMPSAVVGYFPSLALSKRFLHWRRWSQSFPLFQVKCCTDAHWGFSISGNSAIISQFHRLLLGFRDPILLSWNVCYCPPTCLPFHIFRYWASRRSISVLSLNYLAGRRTWLV